MRQSLTKILAKVLRKYAEDLEQGRVELSETEQMDVMSMFTHKALSKEQACNYLNLQRSRFDDLVRLGKIPKGKKRKGFKELVWYEDELYNYIVSHR